MHHPEWPRRGNRVTKRDQCNLPLRAAPAEDPGAPWVPKGSLGNPKGSFGAPKAPLGLPKVAGILRPWLNPETLKTWNCGHFENMDWHIFKIF